jgi:hypothetical protein
VTGGGRRGIYNLIRAVTHPLSWRIHLAPWPGSPHLGGLAGRRRGALGLGRCDGRGAPGCS